MGLPVTVTHDDAAHGGVVVRWVGPFNLLLVLICDATGYDRIHRVSPVQVIWHSALLEQGVCPQIVVKPPHARSSVPVREVNRLQARMVGDEVVLSTGIFR
jgi:hypothetical protein